MSDNGQYKGISRRTVARGALWTAPSIIVSTAAPAYAASCAAVNYAAPLNASTVQTASTTSATGTATSSTTGTDAVTYKITSSAGSGTILGAANESTAGGGPTSYYNGTGDLGSDGLQLQQNGGVTGQTITFTFSRAVTDLTFTVADIDSAGTGYYDAVSFSLAPTTIVNGAAVKGAGTKASPLQAINANQQVNSSTLANRSTVTFSGPLTTFSMTFSSATGTTAQQIFLTQMRFTSLSGANC